MSIFNYSRFILEKNSSGHKYFLPSYEEARLICDTNDNFIFYESKHKIDGYDISIFNYRLAMWSHFDNPIPDQKDIKSYEMRGLTFVFNEDGTIFKRYLLLDKFFNIDQTPCSMYSVVKDYKIKNIFNKEDGSIASFIMLPNGEIKAKSKASFESDQAIEIQKIYDEDSNIQRFVKWSLENDIIAVFEFVSPKNRIVLPYTNTKLILLKLRDNKTGEYLDINDYSDQYDGISVVESEGGHTLDNLVNLKKISTDREGWVVQFENGKMIKIKTDWYMNLHGLYTNDLQRENTLIDLIIKEQIDDIMSQLNDPLKKEEVDKVNNIINNYIKNISHMVDDLVSDYHGSKKDFAIKYHKNKIFSIAMGVINGRDKIDLIKSRILTDTKNLMDARKWLEQHS
jgi:T4 RnlA family RNA ligase